MRKRKQHHMGDGPTIMSVLKDVPEKLRSIWLLLIERYWLNRPPLSFLICGMTWSCVIMLGGGRLRSVLCVDKHIEEMCGQENAWRALWAHLKCCSYSPPTQTHMRVFRLLCIWYKGRVRPASLLILQPTIHSDYGSTEAKQNQLLYSSIWDVVTPCGVHAGHIERILTHHRLKLYRKRVEGVLPPYVLHIFDSHWQLQLNKPCNNTHNQHF